MSAKRQRQVARNERRDSHADVIDTALQLTLLPPQDIDTSLDSRASWTGLSTWGYLFLP
jgi:hypothetical protein